MVRGETGIRLRTGGVLVVVLALLMPSAVTGATICGGPVGCPLMALGGMPACGEGLTGPMDCCSMDSEAPPPETPEAVQASGSDRTAVVGAAEADRAQLPAPERTGIPRLSLSCRGGPPLFKLYSSLLI